MKAIKTLVVAVALAASSAMAGTYAVDTTKAMGPLTGLWWNPQESGWGMTLTQQYGVVYMTFFTYDKHGLPTWYAVSCNIDNAAGSCAGNAYEFEGGAPMIGSWYDPPEAILVGGVTIYPSSNDTMSVLMQGFGGASWNVKSLVRQIFAAPPVR